MDTPFYRQASASVATPARRYKFIGCEILYREACYLAATSSRQVDVEFLLKGLHDLPSRDMRQRIQAAVDAVPADGGYAAILLGYARCNDGLAGVQARHLPLVIPRAHDCITLFFGSRAAYMEHFASHPGTYYMTTGWAERNGFEEGRYSRPAYGREGVMARLGLTESYDSMVARYGRDNADYIVASVGGWKKSYNRCLYIEMGICNEQCQIEEARQRALENDWEFTSRRGDLALLRRLFEGDWNDDFVVVPPGSAIVARQDERVLDAAAPEEPL